MGPVRGVTELTLEELGSTDDPVALLNHAWAMEPALRLSERYAALDRLEELIDSGQAPPTPAGRDWAMELLAERAIDAAANVRLEEGRELAERVIAQADQTAQIALARATLARGRAVAWLGTEDATRRGDEILAEAEERFARLGNREWQGFTRFWRGNAIHLENGELREAVIAIRQALEIVGPDSPRRSTILTFLADALNDIGDFDAASQVLEEAAIVADRDDDEKSRSYVAWSAAQTAAGRDDAPETIRLLRLAEQHGTAADWFYGHAGVDFLADCADQLDRVGLTEEAYRYLVRAQQHFSTHRDTVGGEDDSITQAEASLLGRSGDPLLALEKLAALVRSDWLERRLVWRNTMLSAWATLRAGAREDAAVIAARALAEADANGGPSVAPAGEGLITRALAPLAEEAGSAHARALISRDGERWILRLFGTPTLITPVGSATAMPTGKPGELLRRLAVSETGLLTEAVLADYFPDTDRATALQRLRQFLSRIRAAVGGDLVIRDGDALRLAPAWVDIRAFRSLSAAAARATGSRQLQYAWAAEALAQRGPVLAVDPYAEWAEQVREDVATRRAAFGDRLD